MDDLFDPDDVELPEGMVAVEPGMTGLLDALDAVGAGDPVETLDEQRRRAARARLIENLYTADSLDELPLPTWQIHEMIVRGSYAYLAGEPGNGKSFVALSMAACVATGIDWYGIAVERGRVLYIAAEGAVGIRKRLRAWEHENGRRVPSDALHVLATPVQIAPDNPEWTELYGLIEEHAYDLVVIDTQARCTNGLEENAQREMSGVVALLEHLRASASNPTVLVVHHSPKTNGQVPTQPKLRGSSALTGACETIIGVLRTNVRKRNAAPGADPTKIEVSCERQKDSDEFETLYFDLVDVTTAAGIHSAVLRPGTQAKKATAPKGPPVQTAVVSRNGQKVTSVNGGGVVIDMRREPKGREYARRWMGTYQGLWAPTNDVKALFPEISKWSDLRAAIERTGLSLESRDLDGRSKEWRLSADAIYELSRPVDDGLDDAVGSMFAGGDEDDDA